MINQILELNGLAVERFDNYTDWQMFLKLFLFTIATSLVFLMIYFVFQTNNQMTNSAMIMDYEKKISGLKEANNNLEINLVNSGSIEKLLPKIQNMNFEKAVNVSFIKVSGDKIVVNQN